MSAPSIPPVNYVTNSEGKPVFVQLPIEDWTAFIEEYERLVALLQFKSKLKSAFHEIRQIQKGEKPATTFSEFLQD
ncbi:MAG: hypothetical protein ABIO24_14245, partial [Saprospiraceae bacterium]